MDFIIREIELHELNFMKEMFYESLYVPEGYPKYPVSIIFKPELMKYYGNWGQKNDIAFVTEYENNLVGAIWSRLFTEKNKGYGFINDQTPEICIAVKSEFRNKGIGKNLIRKLIVVIRTMGFLTLSLSVDKQNRAKNLYISEGFRIIEEAGTAYTMKLDIESEQ